jgi:purine-binding chemotaxis protein CheW
MKPLKLKKAGIDWGQVRDRLRVSESAVEEAQAASPRRIEDAYRRRAVWLAKGHAERKAVSTGLPVLVFRLAKERYAIELKELAEVLPFAGCAPVPGSPQFLGAINLRGELRAVVDLGRLLLSSAGENSDAGFVLILRNQNSRPGGHGVGAQEIGVKVDDIQELREIQPEELTLPAQGNYGKGLVCGTLLLLDVDALLAEVFSKEGALTI